MRLSLLLFLSVLLVAVHGASTTDPALVDTDIAFAELSDVPIDVPNKKIESFNDLLKQLPKESSSLASASSVQTLHPRACAKAAFVFNKQKSQEQDLAKLLRQLKLHPHDIEKQNQIRIQQQKVAHNRNQLGLLLKQLNLHPHQESFITDKVDEELAQARRKYVKAYRKVMEGEQRMKGST